MTLSDMTELEQLNRYLLDVMNLINNITAYGLGEDDYTEIETRIMAAYKRDIHVVSETEAVLTLLLHIIRERYESIE